MLWKGKEELMFTMAMVTQQGILKLIRSQKIKKNGWITLAMELYMLLRCRKNNLTPEK